MVVEVVVDVLDVVVAACLWLAVELAPPLQPAIATATNAANAMSRFMRLSPTFEAQPGATPPEAS